MDSRTLLCGHTVRSNCRTVVNRSMEESMVAHNRPNAVIAFFHESPERNKQRNDDQVGNNSDNDFHNTPQLMMIIFLRTDSFL